MSLKEWNPAEPSIASEPMSAVESISDESALNVPSISLPNSHAAAIQIIEQEVWAAEGSVTHELPAHATAPIGWGNAEVRVAPIQTLPSPHVEQNYAHLPPPPVQQPPVQSNAPW